MSRMVVPGSTYWNMGIGRDMGEVKDDEEGVANMRHLGQVIDWLGQSIKTAKIEYPRG